MRTGNLFADAAPPEQGERFETLLRSSSGHMSSGLEVLGSAAYTRQPC